MSNKLNFKFDRDFTVVPNVLLRDTRLSYKAKGIFLQIISVPETWQFSVRGLAALAKESDRAITSGLKELEACGYLEWCKTKTLNNQFSVEVNVFLPDPSAILPYGKTSTGENAIRQNAHNKEKKNKSILETENRVTELRPRTKWDDPKSDTWELNEEGDATWATTSKA